MLIRGLQGGLELDRFAFCFQTANYLALGARAIGYTPEKPAGKTLGEVNSRLDARIYPIAAAASVHQQ
jgi:hypothetical protein